MSTNNYIDRFNSTWKKILFRPDFKSQSTELNELQSLINYQYTQAFDFLFSNYKVIKGLNISVDSFTSVGYKLKVSSGQIFVILQNKGYFINIPDNYCEFSYNSRTSIGININLTYLTNDDYLRDPITGGPLCGDKGADRLVISTNLVLDQDSFPIAIAQGRGIGEYPYIFYYSPSGYSLQYDSNYIPGILADYLALRLYEESGDFIGEGLRLSISSSTSFTVSAGYAYIKGYKVDLCFPFSYNLPSYTSIPYSVYLTNYGAIIVDSNPPKSIENTILIGIVQYINNSYFSVPTNNRTLTNSDIELLISQSQTNQDNFASFLLNNSLTNTNVTNSNILSGFLIDSFTNLNNSDVNALNYNASIVPTYGILRPGFKSTYINFNNTTSSNLLFSNIVNKQSSPYYLAPTISESVVINQNRATSFLPLTNTITTASISVNPPNGTPDTTTSSFNSITDILPLNSYLLTPTNSITTVTSTLNTILVTVNGVGFGNATDNLAITFGNIAISQFTIITGNQGSTNQTIQADETGSISFSFNLPGNLLLQDYIIQVSNGTIQASCSFRSQQTNLVNLAYTGNIGQTFTIDSPIVVSKVNLALRQVPTFISANLNLLLVSIVTTSNGIPTNNILGQGILNLNSVTTSADGSSFSTITFDIPITLPNSGQYAIVISSLASAQPLQFYYADSSQQSLNSISISGDQPLIGGNLLLCVQGTWTNQPNQDLTFQLIQAVPSTANSECTFTISNPLGNINFINRSISELAPCNTQINYLYKNNLGNWIPLNSSQPIQGDVNSVDIKIVLSGNSVEFPIALLNQSYFNIYSNLTDSVWISKTSQYTSGYTNVEVQFDYYQPTGTTIIISFTSNNGQTWELLTRGTSVLSNGNIPLYTATWAANNINPTTTTTDITGATATILRTSIALKVEFTTTDASTVPYVMNLKGVVY